MFQCKGCERREYGCHSSCESYLKEKAKREKISEGRLRDSNLFVNVKKEKR